MAAKPGEATFALQLLQEFAIGDIGEQARQLPRGIRRVDDFGGVGERPGYLWRSEDREHVPVAIEDVGPHGSARTVGGAICDLDISASPRRRTMPWSRSRAATDEQRQCEERADHDQGAFLPDQASARAAPSTVMTMDEGCATLSGSAGPVSKSRSTPSMENEGFALPPSAPLGRARERPTPSGDLRPARWAAAAPAATVDTGRATGGGALTNIRPGRC